MGVVRGKGKRSLESRVTYTGQGLEVFLERCKAGGEIFCSMKNEFGHSTWGIVPWLVFVKWICCFVLLLVSQRAYKKIYIRMTL